MKTLLKDVWFWLAVIASIYIAREILFFGATGAFAYLGLILATVLIGYLVYYNIALSKPDKKNKPI